MTNRFRNTFGDHVKNKDWLAGFFDGEGCIYYHPNLLRATTKGKKYYSPSIQVCIGQSGDVGKALLEALQTEYGFGKITTAHGSSLTKQTPYITRLSGKKAIKFLELIEPKLILKQEKAQQVIKEGKAHFYGE